MDVDDAKAWLIEEHKHASQLTFHIDELRNRLTSFFVTFAGIAGAGLTAALSRGTSGGVIGLAMVLLFVIAIVGTTTLRIVGRLRYIQLESFGIITTSGTTF